MFSNQFSLLIPNSTNIVFKLFNLVYLSFPTIPCGYLKDIYIFSVLIINTRDFSLKYSQFRIRWLNTFTLFFPRLLISRQRVNCSSVNSCFDKRSLNSSIGRLMMSITVIGSLKLVAIKSKSYLFIRWESLKMGM